MPVYVTTGDGVSAPHCLTCSGLDEAKVTAKRQGGYIWREVDGTVEVWSNLDLEGLYGWENAPADMAAFLRKSR
jgi:hypothetical protein